MAELIPIFGDFALWNWIFLRGAGFPTEGIRRLASPKTIAALARAEEASAAVTHACNAALEVYDRAIQEVPPELKSALKKVGKALRAQKVPTEVPEPYVSLFASVLAVLAEKDAIAKVEAAAVAQTFQEERLEISNALREAVAEDRFREAVLWQNRRAYERGFGHLLREPVGSTDWRTRQAEQAVASYYQRYLLKNDTIGFFGPMGWAQLISSAAPIAIRPGATLLSKRTVHFEYWAIDELARAICETEDIRADLAPRRVPSIRLEGSVLHHPIERTTELPEEFAMVLAACDGATTARELAIALDFNEPDELYALLAELAERRLISWTVELPTAGPAAEVSLRGILERIKDPAQKQRALAPLDAIEEKRGTVARASGDAGALEVALAELDSTFTVATGADASRLDGQVYAGRTIAYEDCVRAIDVDFGAPFIERLGRPLSLLLQSARWYTYEIAARYRRELNKIFDTLAAGSSTVDFQKFWEHVPPLFPGTREGSIVGAVAAEMATRWWELLSPAPDARRHTRTVAELAPKVLAAFAAPHPGWPSARHHSPDIMIAAAGEEAIRAGNYLLVLGELHTAINTIMNPLFVEEHPRPEELIIARERDLPEPCIAPAWSKKRTRADFYSLSRHDFDLESGATKSWRQRSQVLTPAELIVEKRDGKLFVSARNQRVSFDIIAFIEHHLIAESHGAFSLERSAVHTPRVAIDDLVISRERWRFDPQQLPFLGTDAQLERFTGARAFARAHGLPDRVFVKLPEEQKPFYLDFSAPIFIDNFSKLAKKASHISISEMLPALDELWLPDAEGRRYTSELRIVARDPIPFPCDVRAST